MEALSKAFRYCIADSGVSLHGHIWPVLFARTCGDQGKLYGLEGFLNLRPRHLRENKCFLLAHVAAPWGIKATISILIKRAVRLDE
jgi:hypothetical protein